MSGPVPAQRERALLAAARDGTRPPGPLRLAGVRRFDGADNLLLRYELA